MPYNEAIDLQIRSIVDQWTDTSAKKMFGGVCHLLEGKMVCGVYKDYLILRLGEEQARAALKKAHVRPFDFTGRPMKGWVMVAQNGFAKPGELDAWLNQARQFVQQILDAEAK